MSNKSVVLNLGGEHDFKLVKSIENSVERFSVSMGGDGYRAVSIAESVTWAEAGAALNVLKDELQDAFDSLVNLSDLSASGARAED